MVHTSSKWVLVGEFYRVLPNFLSVDLNLPTRAKAGLPVISLASAVMSHQLHDYPTVGHNGQTVDPALLSQSEAAHSGCNHPVCGCLPQLSTGTLSYSIDPCPIGGIVLELLPGFALKGSKIGFSQILDALNRLTRPNQFSSLNTAL
jgi:hypothetical protein